MPQDLLKQPPLETDPRFPTGPRVGFWIQRGWGRQKTSLYLAFAGGRISGCGRDIIGRYEFSGTYDLETGRVTMVKQYDGGHRVNYDGANQGDGLWLWGVWTLDTIQGGFHLWPEGEDDPTLKRLSTQRQTPADTPPRRLKREELLPA